MIKQLAATALSSFLCSSVLATISVTSGGFTYSQSFDSLASGGAAPWTNNSTIGGWSLFISTLGAPATYRAEIGNQDIGSFTSYGASGSSERALGAIGDSNAYFGSPASGAIAGFIAVAFTNNAGVSLDSFTLKFKGEQWRHATAFTPAQTMVLEYGFGSTFSAVGSWIAPGANFDWTSPLFGAGAGGVDGNTAGAVLNRGGTASVSWAAGQTLWIRWIERNDVGSDQGLAIDDLSFSVTAVPEPSQTAMLLAGGLAVLALTRRRRRN